LYRHTIYIERICVSRTPTLTATVDESGSLSKMIKVDIMFGASSSRSNLLFLKKYPIRYELDLLTTACKQLSKREQNFTEGHVGERRRALNYINYHKNIT